MLNVVGICKFLVICYIGFVFEIMGVGCGNLWIIGG